MTTSGPLAVVGGGNMALAILQGGISAGVLQPGGVIVSEPDAGKHAALRSLGVQVVASNAALMEGLAPGVQVLLAVKPQQLGEVGAELSPHLLGGRWPVALSILAGTPASVVRRALGGAVRVVRLMPNTPARVQRGITAVSLGEGATEADAAFALALFGSVGEVVRIDEDMMDAFTAVAASGPAYVYWLAQAMVQSARSLGFDEQMASLIVRQTVVGAGAMLDSVDEPPGRLLANVQSKGGTTEAAMKVLEAAGAVDTFVRALTAARDRGRELAGPRD